MSLQIIMASVQYFTQMQSGDYAVLRLILQPHNYLFCSVHKNFKKTANAMAGGNHVCSLHGEEVAVQLNDYDQVTYYYITAKRLPKSTYCIQKSIKD